MGPVSAVEVIAEPLHIVTSYIYTLSSTLVKKLGVWSRPSLSLSSCTSHCMDGERSQQRAYSYIEPKHSVTDHLDLYNAQYNSNYVYNKVCTT